MRICRDCGLQGKTKTDLKLFKKQTGARYGRANWCRVCFNAYSRAGQWRRRDKIDVLKRQPCTDCGKRFPPVCMDFDHIKGTKNFGVAEAEHKPWATVLTEIAKCDLVCANCHRIRTAKKRGVRWATAAIL